GAAALAAADVAGDRRPDDRVVPAVFDLAVEAAAGAGAFVAGDRRVFDRERGFFAARPDSAAAVGLVFGDDAVAQGERRTDTGDPAAVVLGAAFGDHAVRDREGARFAFGVVAEVAARTRRFAAREREAGDRHRAGFGQFHLDHAVPAGDL